MHTFILHAYVCAPQHTQRIFKLMVVSNKCFPGSSVVKTLPAIQETWVRSLIQEELLKKEMATHSNIIVRTKKPGRLESMRLEKNLTNLATKQQQHQLNDRQAWAVC